MYLLEVIRSEEMEGNGYGLLKSACGETKNIKHFEHGLGTNEYSMEITNAREMIVKYVGLNN